MADNTVSEWRYTRTYDVGDGPWPTTDEASVSFDTAETAVRIEGVFHAAGGREACVRNVAHDPAERSVRVELTTVETGEEFVFDVGGRIHYAVDVSFSERVPGTVTLRHIDRRGTEQFETTSAKSDEESA